MRTERKEVDFSIEEQGLDRLEGRNPIREAFKAKRDINKVWVIKGAYQKDKNLRELIYEIKQTGAVIMEVERLVLDKMAVTRSHQGIIAQVAAHTYWELLPLLEDIKVKGEVPLLLLLDEVQDSYNLGSILRIADAAGVHGVIIPERRSVLLDAAVAKASAGAIEYVPVVRVKNLSQTILTLKKEGFWLAGTTLEASQNYDVADWSGPLGIVVGNEGKGISPNIQEHCDFLVSIPMQGKVNSLNAAVATGIIVFTAAQQRQAKSND